MPELPDILLYRDALRQRIVRARLVRARAISPSLLRTVEPSLDAACGLTVTDVVHLGKRLVMLLEQEIALVLHLMIAGRLRWTAGAAVPRAKIVSATFEFDTGTLTLTEAGTRKRASLHVVRGRDALAALDPGGIDVLAASLSAFRARVLAGNHTLKRALTDPRAFCGVGNAYSDEILHAARLSPLQRTRQLGEQDIERLHESAKRVLIRWIDALRVQFAGRFPGPGEITAFRPGFAVHGRFGQPCPVCEAPVQRIRYAENETNYCARCQTGGRVLADRSLSRLLKDDWPRTLEEPE